MPVVMMEGRVARLRDVFADSSTAVGLSTRPLNVAASIASILGLLFTILVTLKIEADAIPLLYLCGLSFFLVLRYVRHERWARYAEGVDVMERAARRLCNVADQRLFGDPSPELFRRGLQEALSAFAEAFTLVTGSNCRATIKELYTQEVPGPPPRRGRAHTVERELVVATLVRSDADANRDVAAERPERVSENSDFVNVLETGRPFLGSDLPAMWLAGDYTNSRWPSELRKTRDFPYRSAIVWPVQADPALAGDAAPNDERILAFLCVDSKRRRSFRGRADVKFGAIFAHALHPPLRHDVQGRDGDA